MTSRRTRATGPGTEGFDYDVLVVGSGFGGAVTALRLTEKGYRVGVLEAGRRFADDDFAKTSWDVRRYLFNPAARCYGILRMDLLRNVFVLSGAGVGGGSLVYANTLYTPPDAFYLDRQWAHVTDWKAELAPHYDTATRMLGVATNPLTTPSDEALRDVAEDLGIGHTYRPTPVGVFFGPPGTPRGQALPDPWFGGAGPARTTCTHCGNCMVGCRVGAKNTVVKNYLHLAEAAGTRVHPLTTAVRVRPLPGPDGAPARGAHGWAVETRPTARPGARVGARPGRRGRTFTARHVVLAAAALGTQRLLHAMRDEGTLADVSPRLGELSRTNSEAILGPRTTRRGADFSQGVAITSSIHPDPVTHIEPVRYGKGSNLLGLLSTVLVDGADPADPGTGTRRRWAAVPRELWRIRRHLPGALLPRRWSEQVVVLLVMQTLDNSITTFTRRGLLGRRRITSKQGVGAPNPTWIPAGHEVTRRIAEKIDGVPLGSVTDLFDVPITGHFIGGCPIGLTPAEGVVDPYHRLHGYDAIHVVDGSTISANLGVNPSLTITAQAERALSLWPNAGDEDPRPPRGDAYVRVAPVPPRAPVVPASAPAALRWATAAPQESAP
ncbi:GMC oxidoreductase [Kineosporia sp. A_224]|uniref:GMC oxidoreductase n=1 Tax=Kineosporia sp. A_224 TaxID=1962180 RepID=UPI000B4BE5C5|nr:GMC family oxidoreductase [Kineosporia sp. A_224]